MEKDATMNIMDVIDQYEVVYSGDRSPRPYICLLYGLALGIDAKLVYEIGVGAGMSTNALLCAMKRTGGMLVSCDVCDCDSVVRDSELREHWRFLHMPSTQMATTERVKADMVYIDGSHDYNMVIYDEALFMPRLRKKGLMVFHDWKSVPSGPGRVCLGMAKSGVEIVMVPTLHGIAIARRT